MFFNAGSFVKRHLPLLCVLLFCLLFLYASPKDPDFGWHYKYGEYIFNNHSLLKDNIYSYTYENYKWANSYWFSQVILYILFNIDGGFTMGLVLGLIFFSVVYLTLTSLSKKTTIVYATLILVSVVMHFYIITVRPMFFSSIFLFLLIYLLIKKKFAVYLLPLLFLVWANMHADFVLGLGIVAFYIFYTVVFERRIDKTIALAFCLSLLVTVLNPYGLLLHQTLLREGNFMPIFYILEFAPPIKASWYVALVSILIPSIFAGITLYLRPKKYMWLITMHLIFLSMGMISGYFLRFATILGALSFLLCLNGVSFPRALSTQFNKARNASLRLIPSFALILSINLLSLMVDAHNVWNSGDTYPAAAVNFIKDEALEGNMFNNFSWGGYLIWKLPEKQTFIDGRMPSWEDESGKLFSDYIFIVKNPSEGYPLLEKYIAQYDIRFVLFPRNDSIVQFLIDERDYIVLFEDETSVVLQNPIPVF